MVEDSKWTKLTKANPELSAGCIKRFEEMAAAGDDLDGEARLVHALAPRASRILDAGCGPGRVGAALAELGHEVVGVDVDPVLIASANESHPRARWLVADLAELDLPALGISETFDVIVCAGNVMTFVAPSTTTQVLTRLAAHLGDAGRLVVGFGAGRDYEFEEFFAEAASAGLRIQQKLATWDVRPFTNDSDFLVAILEGPD